TRVGGGRLPGEARGPAHAARLPGAPTPGPAHERGGGPRAGGRRRSPAPRPPRRPAEQRGLRGNQGHGWPRGHPQGARARARGGLLDLLMPDLSGLDVVAALKADPATAAIPILVMTAKELSREDKRVLNAQAAAVLEKPSVAGAD